MDFKPFYAKVDKVMPKSILNVFKSRIKRPEAEVYSLILILTK